MANRLKMALIDRIFTLHPRGWSQRRIARELGIDRETVAHHLSQGPPESKPANAPIGSGEPGSGSKPANAPIGSPGWDEPPSNRRGVGRSSDCEA
jgi:hypothetical protein